MSVQNATNTTIASALSIPPIPSSPPLLHIRTDKYAGRKYHASSALTEHADLLSICAPFSYTIWKRFRNEVCAQCWRYNGGRRSFLTRRDDEGLPGAHPPAAEKGDPGSRAGSTVGAGLWFCDATCQRTWIAREGTDAVNLFRRLEGARRIRNPKSKPKAGAGPRTEEHEEREIAREVADGAWDAVRAEERSAKQVRRWQSLLLDDYETDMARYVLLALLSCHRERCDHHAGGTPLVLCHGRSLFLSHATVPDALTRSRSRWPRQPRCRLHRGEKR